MSSSRMESDARTRAYAAGHRTFGDRWIPDRIATAPGRLELLGNHIDYNGGPVLAAAIDRNVVVLCSSAINEPGPIEAVFADVPGSAAVALDPSSLFNWRVSESTLDPANYLRGAVASLLDQQHLGLRTGTRMAIAGDVPIGFGLSSSAALCVGLVLALAQETPDWTDIVLTAQDAEHRAGTPCGTMDQSASVAGGVIHYRGAPLSIRRLDPDLGSAIFAVVDSGVQRSLGSSSYAVRVSESRAALDLARRRLFPDLIQLADLTADGFETLQLRLKTEMPANLLRRLRHVVSETGRVAEGLAAVEQSDWTRFGRLMNASGRSSAWDYEISHPRVEEIVAEAQVVSGVYGARMMGGGEGGTALILLDRSAGKALDEKLRSGYFSTYHMDAQPDLVHVFRFAPGASVKPWSSIE